MASSRERVCPSCSAPAEAQQRWCLECGTELARRRRRGLGPTVSIATTVAVLVGATSAGAYTLLQDGKQPPPPATTVAQEAPPATVPPETTPPATEEPALPPPAEDPLPLPEPDANEPPLDTSSPPPPPPDDGFDDGFDDGAGDTGGSQPQGDNGADKPKQDKPKPEKPKLVLTDIALGAAAVVYAPYGPDDVDLGDPSRAVDGSRKTAWSTPSLADPSAHPQIGIYVDLGGREQLRRLSMRTPTPGMSVEVYGARSGPPGSITAAGWDHLTDAPNAEETTTLKLPKRPYRYILVWITGVPAGGDTAAISQLSLLSMQPE